jgi:hypothetical protein
LKLRSIESRLSQKKPVPKVVIEPQEGEIDSRLSNVEHKITFLSSVLSKISFLEDKINDQKALIDSQAEKIKDLETKVPKPS